MVNLKPCVFALKTMKLLEKNCLNLMINFFTNFLVSV